MPEGIKNYFDELAENLLSTLTTPDDYLNKIALSVVVILLGLLLYFLFKKIIHTYISSYQTRFKLVKTFKSIMSSLIVLLSFAIWFRAINVLVLIALVAGIFTVIMVRGLASNIIGFFVIKYRNYFKIGHRIEINGVIGDVIDINSVNFKLLEVRNWLSADVNTGRVIKLPNKIIFDESMEIIGMKYSFIWHEIKYVLSFDSDWEAAEAIMAETGEAYFKEWVQPDLDMDNDHLSQNTNLHPIVTLDTNDAGIVLILRYLVDYRRVSTVTSYLQREMLTQIDDHPEIKFAVFDIRILPT